MASELPVGLYVHYPWCVRKCPYCDFNSYPIRDRDCTENKYLEALLSDFSSFEEYLEGRSLLSVYFGGGTPSLFSPFEMEKVIKRISPYLTEKTEISMEANPGTVDLDLLKSYRDIGINRISIGVQSFNDVSLKLLGRIHSSEDAVVCCENVIRAGFDNFNIDIMHGLPKQNASMALDDIRMAVDFGCNHLSWYELTIEEDTAFGNNPPVLPSEDTLSEIEERGFELLASLGFNRYEVSGYTKDRRCLHNQNYWYFGDYIGIGAGAHSKLKIGNDTFRNANPQIPSEYISKVLNSQLKLSKVNPEDLPFEFMLNRLRIFDDVRYSEFENTTGLSFEKVRDKLENSQSLGLIIMDKESYRLTEKGRWMLNDILEMFLD
ncbi:radical SAM family heme chaperone HemW [Succinivibrio sp.]|uniref:radical SAM family heme chaperone HemW n=1 Tax=Succinivibrio sp. TaxID=2053619 RepID=UPI00386994FC